MATVGTRSEPYDETLYSYLVGCCPISDIFGKGEPILAKRKLSPISVLPCQKNQISGKQLTKQLFYYSHPEC